MSSTRLHRTRLMACFVFAVWLLLTLLLSQPPALVGAEDEPGDVPTPSVYTYLPLVANGGAAPPTPALALPYHAFAPVIHFEPLMRCPTSSAAHWDAMAPGQSYIANAASSPDLNLRLRGWRPVSAALRFVVYDYPPDEPPDGQHPLYLSHVLARGESSFVAAYQIAEWDWFGCNCPIPRPCSPYPVTLLGLRVTPGQAIHVPDRNVPVSPQGAIALVLYADERQLALKYTAEDRVDTGYLVHLENLCVDANLLELYRRLDLEGRHLLPVVYADSIVGVAGNSEIGVVVRDSGSFLDPRSWQDWWRDQPGPIPVE